ncbi:MAG: MdtA/MuxA family multidrug efflux RND transporter periplasmic adaptor subunit [Proteobacteria bacterium]|nr:MdtA/MuxA family multidrug efflux RND transporter periplasmic adaptor subunit [Pseudomonadota bacterium]
MDEQVEPLVRADPTDRTSIRTRRSRRRMGRLIVILLLLVAAGAGWYWWANRTPQPVAPPVIQGGGTGRGGAPPQPVGVATAEKGEIRVILNALGTVTPLAVVNVRTQLNGPLVEVGFKEGQYVEKGDFLAQIDPRPYQVALEQAQGQLARDMGLLQQAQTNFKRFQTLSKQDSIAQQQVDDQRFLVAQYTGTVQADQGAVDAAKLNLTYARIVAPVAGRVGLRKVDPGNYVTTGDTNPIVVITQMTPISVLFAVPEDNLQAILAAKKAGGTLTVEAYDRSNTKKLAAGELATLDNQIDTTTGTVTLRAVFENGDLRLYPNQFVNVRLLVNTLKDVIRVPVQAVQRGEPGTFVYVVGDDSKVSVRKIGVGPLDAGFQQITSGLAVGDRVVTEGTDRLRDGATVVVPAGGSMRGGGRGTRGADAGAPKPVEGEAGRPPAGAGRSSPADGARPAERPAQ